MDPSVSESVLKMLLNFSPPILFVCAMGIKDCIPNRSSYEVQRACIKGKNIRCYNFMAVIVVFLIKL